MKYLFTCLPVILLLFVSCKEEVPTPDQIIASFVETYEAHESMSFDLNYQMKFFSSIDDTNKKFMEVSLVRDTADTLMGAYVWIDLDSLEIYWDGERAYEINHKKNLITEFPIHKTWPIDRDPLNVYFLKPHKLKSLWEDSTVVHSLINDTTPGSKQYLLNFIIPADDYLSGGWKRVWLSRNDLTLTQTRSSYDMQGENQYRERKLSNIRFNQSTSEEMAGRFAEYKNTYAIEAFKRSEENMVEPFKAGDKFPDLTGWLSKEQDSLTLSDLDAPLVILDFWYMDCMPCIMAIPHLNKAYADHKDAGLQVIGVNPFNNNEKDQARMPNFLSYNPIEYPVLYVTREQAQLSQVRGYPTFYVLNNKQEVLYSGIGYSEELAHTLDSVIQVHLPR